MHTALRLERRPSRQLTWLLLALHAAAAATLAWLAPPPVVTIPLLLVMGVSLAHGIGTQAALDWPGAVVALQRQEDGRWTLFRRDGRTELAYLRPDSRIGERWLVLRFAGPGRLPVPVVLAPDGLTPGLRRRLAVLLRWLPEDAAPPAPRAWWRRCLDGFESGGRHAR